MKNGLTLAALALVSVAAVSAQNAPMAPPRVAPTVDQILSLKRAGSPEISPDGRWVAYTVRDTNWDDNAYETEIWLADATGGATRQLTNAKKSSQSPAWSPDGSKLAFISDRTDKRQIYVINPQGGEAEALTSLEDGVGSFAWSPDGQTIAYTATEPKPATIKDREKKYGEFQVVEQDHRMTHLFTHRPRYARDAHADQRRLHRRQLLVVARRQEHRVRPPHQPRAQERRLRRHLDRHRRRRVDPASSSRRTAPTRTRCGRPTDRGSRSRPRWPTRRSSTPTA